MICKMMCVLVIGLLLAADLQKQSSKFIAKSLVGNNYNFAPPKNKFAIPYNSFCPIYIFSCILCFNYYFCMFLQTFLFPQRPYPLLTKQLVLVDKCYQRCVLTMICTVVQKIKAVLLMG